jgi:sugar phosphate isomerase/epimerase
MAPHARAELEFALERNQMYVFTLALNDSAYRPDWLEHTRLAYTCRAADLLASLLPEGVVGSISTIPGAHGERAQSRGARDAIAWRLLAAAAHLADLEDRTGRRIVLSVEPEPGCMLEGAFDTVSFFRDHVFHGDALRAARIGESTARKHLGVCLDACHLAVAFEKPLDALATFAREGITVGKLQVSAAVQLDGAWSAREILPRLYDGVHLHQTRVRRGDGSIRSYDDITSALVDLPEGLWRTHVHVPVDRMPPPPYETTKNDLEELVRLAVEQNTTTNFEVETCSWNVLPPGVRGVSLVEDVARELQWTRNVAEGT